MRRRPKRPGKYSLSCTDEDWERIKARASHAGSKSVSAFIVEAAMAVDPSPDPAWTSPLPWNSRRPSRKPPGG